MVELVTPEFLSGLKTLYRPTPCASDQVTPHLWAVLAAVAFGASNAPDAVPLVFQYALNDLVRVQRDKETPDTTAQQE